MATAEKLLIQTSASAKGMAIAQCTHAAPRGALSGNGKPNPLSTIHDDLAAAQFRLRGFVAQALLAQRAV